LFRFGVRRGVLKVKLYLIFTISIYEILINQYIRMYKNEPRKYALWIKHSLSMTRSHSY